MQQFTQRLRASTSIKVFGIGFLILVLLIPMSMIKSVIYERQSMGRIATQDIQQTWGNQQLITGPILVVPYDIVWNDDDGERHIRSSRVFQLPQVFNIDANVQTEERARGKHVVPVYTTSMTFTGTLPGASELARDGHTMRWSDAYIAVGVSDGRAIAATPSITVSGHTLRFKPGGQNIAHLPPQIIAPISDFADAIADDASLTFSMELQVKGSELLRFLPIGDTTRVRMTSDWHSPSFIGSYLPETREVSDTGFTAEWTISSIGRSLPARWRDGTSSAKSAEQSAFGVSLYLPISIYRLTERAAKYGVLFIGLTFVAYFMFEVTGGLRLHPLQYLMVGMANALFYLLLVSFAEHLGFGVSYILSARASSGLIVGYSMAVLRTRGRSLVMLGILLLLYGFLYMTLQAEDYALLAGSLGLWVTLALVMYVTRRIDWYGNDTDDAPVQDDLLGGSRVSS